jgi:hypothetical protein
MAELRKSFRFISAVLLAFPQAKRQHGKLGWRNDYGQQRNRRTHFEP